jgi:hypothetical protein
MRIAALTNVADDPRTMLTSGLTQQWRSTAVSSHQCYFGHRGAAIHLLAQIDERHWTRPLFL